jgi:hypothetical protein
MLESVGPSATPPPLVTVVDPVAAIPAEPAVALVTGVPEPAGVVGEVDGVVATPAGGVGVVVVPVSPATACIGTVFVVRSAAPVISGAAQPAVKPAPPEIAAPPLATRGARRMLGSARTAWRRRGLDAARTAWRRRGSLAAGVSGSVADGVDVFETGGAWLGTVATNDTAELPAALADWTIACAR